MIRYCLPIIDNKPEGVIATIKEHDKLYEYFEIWLDYLEELDLDFVSKLANELGSRAIFLFRRKQLERIKTSIEERYKVMTVLAKSEAWLDLDLLSQTGELNFARENRLGLQTIISYHNFLKTPQLEVFHELLHRMRDNKATICKFATMCHSRNDALRLMSFGQELSRRGIRHIVLGMGEFGKITRVFGTLWGNEMIFAPLSVDSLSAPGQLTRGDLATVFEVLE